LDHLDRLDQLVLVMVMGRTPDKFKDSPPLLNQNYIQIHSGFSAGNLNSLKHLMPIVQLQWSRAPLLFDEISFLVF
jgi:hypothetical protein